MNLKKAIPTREEVIATCEEQVERFDQLARDFPYEVKGILNSEMLLACSITKLLGVSSILESGRARGNSTEILARFFLDNQSQSIISLESSKYSEDSVIAMQRLNRKFPNLVLRFGDSFAALPGLAEEVGSCAVLIDGPKGRFALSLASVLLRNVNVKVIFLHDTHLDTDVRMAIEKIFPDTYSTDEPEFVRRFSRLDARSWQVYSEWEGYRDWGPYARGEIKMRSYGPTLSAIFNAGHGMEVESQVLQEFNLQPIRSYRYWPIRLLRSVQVEIPRPNEMGWFVRFWRDRISSI